jgi:ABC-type multidrug transport system fused ATPase/permease subunit
MTIAAGTVLVLGFGAREVLRGRLTVGQLLVVLAYIGSVYSPLETLSSNLAEVQQQLIDLHLGFELIDTEPDIRDLPGATPLGNVEGSITFEDVHFAYTGRQHTLQDISLHVPAGQRIAIVGPTGAGKTTLASLIPRFYQPDRGRVLIDGRDIQSVTVKSLRDHVSIVLQESLLFSTTIRDNIRYGRLDATDEEIVAAARAANAHDFIMALPEQYDADVGERGVQLSLGERQRIGIARAFLKNAPILILDEPTSSIDSRTEAAILDALERLIAGRTTILIAHRLSTLRNVDQIVVLHHGKQYESGTHEELMKAGGLYWQLYRLQSGEPYRRVRDAGLEV